MHQKFEYLRSKFIYLFIFSGEGYSAEGCLQFLRPVALDHGTSRLLISDPLLTLNCVRYGLNKHVCRCEREKKQLKTKRFMYICSFVGLSC